MRLTKLRGPVLAQANWTTLPGLDKGAAVGKANQMSGAVTTGTTGRTADASRYDNRGIYDVVADRVMSLEVETPMPWVRVLRVTGEIDSAAAARLVDCVRSQLDRGAEHVVLDLGGIDLLTPAGLGAWVTARQATLATGAVLHLAGVLLPEVTAEVQERWRPAEFEVHRTTVEALAAISEWPRDWESAGRRSGQPAGEPPPFRGADGVSRLQPGR